MGSIPSSLILLAASPLVVAFNFLILASWIRYHRLRTPNNCLIVSLAIADMGIGLLLPIALVIDISTSPYESFLYLNNSTNITEEEASRDLCPDFFLNALLGFSSASLLSITAIAIDRLSSVVYPLRYNYEVKISFARRFLFFLWTYAFVLIGFALPRLIWTASSSSFSVSLLIATLCPLLIGPCLMVNMFAYGHIYFVARTHARAIHSVEVSLNNSCCDMSSSTAILDTQSHYRYGLALALILGTLFLTWIPLTLTSLLDTFNGTEMMSESKNLRLFTITPILILSGINPWLYGLRSSEIKIAAFKLLDSLLTWVMGRPTGYLELSSDFKGYEMSCVSNVRTIGVSIPSNYITHNNPESVSHENGKPSNGISKILLCDSVEGTPL